MFRFLSQLAHDAELHNEATSDAEHLFTEWYVAVPVFLALVAFIGYVLLKIVKWPVPRVLLVFMGTFLVVGIGSYEQIPALSIIAISAGTGLTLFFTLGAISK